MGINKRLHRLADGLLIHAPSTGRRFGGCRKVMQCFGNFQNGVGPVIRLTLTKKTRRFWIPRRIGAVFEPSPVSAHARQQTPAMFNAIPFLGARSSTLVTVAKASRGCPAEKSETARSSELRMAVARSVVFLRGTFMGIRLGLVRTLIRVGHDARRLLVPCPVTRDRTTGFCKAMQGSGDVKNGVGPVVPVTLTEKTHRLRIPRRVGAVFEPPPVGADAR